MKRKPKHRAIRSRSGIIPGASPLRIIVFPEDMTDRKPVGDIATGDKENSANGSGKVQRSMKDAKHRDTLIRLSPVLDPTSSPDAELGPSPLTQLSNSASSARSLKSTKSLTRSNVGESLSDLSLQTPKFDRLDEVDIGMLGLDRFHWSEEGEELIKSYSSHIKNDNVALISFWEEGQWMEENNQW